MTNGEYLAFIQDSRYGNPEFWLSDGWSTVNRLHWSAPSHWERIEGEWWQYTLGGIRSLTSMNPCAT